MIKVMLKGISVSHGKRVVDDAPYLEHFKQRGKDVEHFLRDVIGRDKRYLFDSEQENTITLSLEAVQAVLQKTGLQGEDLDMIVLSSQLPEYIAPPSSIKLHYAIKGKRECVCYDMNSNCCGMALSFEQTVKYMSVSPHVQRALIVGCDYINLTINPEEESLYGHYGDAACAIILEKTEQDCGLIDSQCMVNSDGVDVALFPGCGFSNLFRVQDKKELLIKFVPPEENVPASAQETIAAILERNKMSVNDIGMFCLSQYAIINIKGIRKLLGIEEAHSIYIGDQYGYTGTSSPFIALYESIERGLIKRGDYFMLWTIGCGSENIGVLCKY